MSIPAHDLRILLVVAREEDDRHVASLRPASDDIRGLVPVHTGHSYVEENDTEIMVQQVLERVLARVRFQDLSIGSLEDGRERQRAIPVVVHDQDVDGLRDRDA